MMKALGGQRTLVFALTAIVMLLFGAFLGMPNRFPIVEGTEFSPETIFNLVGGVIAPLVLLVKSFAELSRALSARVNNPDDKFKPSDFRSLLSAKEFWVYVVSAGVGISQIFGVKVMPEEEQIVVANGLMAMANYLLQSWGERPAGVTQEIVDVTVSATAASVTVDKNV